MKRLPVVGITLLLLNGCANMSNTEKGAVIGGAGGAGIGALIGSVTHHSAAGALIGGATGALVGGAVGNSEDKAERKAEQRALAAANTPPPLRLEDVAQLAQQHISDSVIIGQIRSTGSVYHLSPEQINWLKEQGVSDAVILEMQATANRYPRRVYSATPVYTTQPVVVVEPPPPPPVSVGVGFGYTRIR